MMRSFLQSQLQTNLHEDFVDLCLDHKLIADLLPTRFTMIDGLQDFVQLEVLSISMHEIEALRGIAHLKKLRRLDLSQNALTGIEEIGDLSALQTLDISHNEIESLDGIERLHQLQELQAGFNLLQTLVPLAGLECLTTLVLNGNRHIHDLMGLPSNLEALHLAKCFVHDYRGLIPLTKLRKLTVSPGSMNGLDLLADLGNLEHLHLQATRMQGLICMPMVHRLNHLQITGAFHVPELQFPEGMPALERIEIQHSALHSPPDLSHCPKIAWLAIKHSPLQNLDGLAELGELTYLNLEGSAIPEADLRQLRIERPTLKIEF